MPHDDVPVSDTVRALLPALVPRLREAARSGVPVGEVLGAGSVALIAPLALPHRSAYGGDGPDGRVVAHRVPRDDVAAALERVNLVVAAQVLREEPDGGDLSPFCVLVLGPTACVFQRLDVLERAFARGANDEVDDADVEGEPPAPPAPPVPPVEPAAEAPAPPPPAPLPAAARAAQMLPALRSHLAAAALSLAEGEVLVAGLEADVVAFAGEGTPRTVVPTKAGALAVVRAPGPAVHARLSAVGRADTARAFAEELGKGALPPLCLFEFSDACIWYRLDGVGPAAAAAAERVTLEVSGESARLWRRNIGLMTALGFSGPELRELGDAIERATGGGR